MQGNILLYLSICIVFLHSCKSSESEYQIKSGEVAWLSIEQADQLKNTGDKKYFIDLYTDWCGWCKVMDNKTFSDKEVADQMNTLFHNIKFDAEQRKDVVFDKQTYQWQSGGRNGINELTLHLLKNQISYPSYVILDKNKKALKVLSGYMEKEDFLSAIDEFK